MPLVFDLHCDTPINIHKKKFNHVRPDKLKESEYIGAVFAHFVEPASRQPFVDAVKIIASTLGYISKVPELTIMRKPSEFDKGRVNLILGVEGGHAFDRNFKQIEVFYDLGIRVFTLTWNNSNRLAHSALEADKKGLTRKGKEFVKALGGFDVILDMSHASTRTVLDVCEIYDQRIIASHSCIRTLNPFLRNIDDRAIKAIAERGGVVGINFSRYHLGEHTILEHIDYLKTRFGESVPAIGSDFDGINDALITEPAQVQDLAVEARKKGYDNAAVENFYYGNFMTCWTRN